METSVAVWDCPPDLRSSSTRLHPAFTYIERERERETENAVERLTGKTALHHTFGKKLGEQFT